MTGRVIGELESQSEEEAENFARIWDAFGAVIKEGIWEDFERREKLLALSRFTTTAGEKRSLKQYAEGLKPNQTEIYYLTGDSLEQLKSNPKLESATARGIEVLLLTDPVDAFWTAAPLDFGGKPLKSLSQGDIDFGLIPLLDDKAHDDKPSGPDEVATIAAIKDVLGDRVSDVRASQRLTTSASCLVAGGNGRDRQLERLLAQRHKGAGVKPVLEINMRHPLVTAIAGAGDAAAGPVVSAAGAGANSRRRIAGGHRCFCNTAQSAGTARDGVADRSRPADRAMPDGALFPSVFLYSMSRREPIFQIWPYLEPYPEQQSQLRTVPRQ